MSVAEIITAIFLVSGGFFFLAGTAGLLRFPDALSRLHALTKADNLGLGFICLGLAVHDGSLPGIILLALIWLLAVLSASLSGFLIARWHHARRGEGDD